MDYDTLLAAAKADPVMADFHALRMAYVRSDQYAPYDMLGDAVVVLRDALTGGDLDAALTAINELLAFNYLDIETHMAADYVHMQRENHEASAYHRAFARGLIQALLATGTGRDFASAWIVINTAEEYTVLRVLGFTPGGQRLMKHEGHSFDVLIAKPRNGGDPAELFFNIDLPFNQLSHQLRDDDTGDS
ncbi:MAG: DUF4919 domain-containing protein [Anaerolineae bacterium]|nr:DUF4919 domain-containing protein [Anaerolineae bacterium]